MTMNNTQSKEQMNRLQEVDEAARAAVTAWDADDGARLNAKGPLRDAMARLNDLASKPGTTHEQ